MLGGVPRIDPERSRKHLSIHRGPGRKRRQHGEVATLSPQNVVPNRPALIVDCIPAKESGSSKGRFLAASLHVGSPLKIKYVEPEEIHGTSYFPKVEVRYRTDDGKEEQEKWSPLSEKEKTAASIPKEALKRILRARSVSITAEDER